MVDRSSICWCTDMLNSVQLTALAPWLTGLVTVFDQDAIVEKTCSASVCIGCISTGASLVLISNLWLNSLPLFRSRFDGNGKVIQKKETQYEESSNAIKPIGKKWDCRL